MRATQTVIWFAAIVACLAAGGQALGGTIRDFVVLNGEAPILVEGEGLVTGLPGTGGDAAILECRDSLFPERRFALSTGCVANIARVAVKAYIPPFSRPGHRFDATVTAFDKTAKLKGGELATCQLYNFGGTAMAIAGGRLAFSDDESAAASVGVVTATALESHPFSPEVAEGTIPLYLIVPNCAVAHQVARAINTAYPVEPGISGDGCVPCTARVVDAGRVVVTVPEARRGDVVGFVGDVLALSIALPDSVQAYSPPPMVFSSPIDFATPSPFDVLATDLIVMSFTGRGWMVASRAFALESGNCGDLIEVADEHSGKRLMAIVTGRKSARYAREDKGLIREKTSHDIMQGRLMQVEAKGRGWQILGVAEALSYGNIGGAVLARDTATGKVYLVRATGWNAAVFPLLGEGGEKTVR